ncbi:hypothetical protein [Streptomyces sp. MN13]
MERVADEIAAALRSMGREVVVHTVTLLSAQLTATAPKTDEPCELADDKEMLWRTRIRTEYGPTLALDDAVGTKIRALYYFGSVINLLGACAAAARYSFPDQGELGRRHALDPFELPTLRPRTTGTDRYPDGTFTSYRLPDSEDRRFAGLGTVVVRRHRRTPATGRRFP